MATHSGECFCGAVKVEVSGDPEGMCIVIADHAVRGQGDRSTLSRCGSLMRFG
jgi:hypothetical protein